MQEADWQAPTFAQDFAQDRMSVNFLPAESRLAGLISGHNAYAIFATEADSRELYLPPWSTIRFSWHAKPWFATYRGRDRVEIPAAAVFGAATGNVELETPGPGISIGVLILPSASERLLRIPSDRLASRITPLGRLWPDANDLQAELARQSDFAAAVAVLERALLARLRPPGPEAVLVDSLFQLLAGQHDVKVGGVAQQLGCTEAKLRRVALRHFAFPIKLLLRRSRFMKSLVAIYGRKQGEWSTLIDQSYHDQSHFIKDAQEFLGCSPSEFIARPSPMTALSMKRRAETLGAPVAALDSAQ